MLIWIYICACMQVLGDIDIKFNSVNTLSMWNAYAQLKTRMNKNGNV